MPIEAAPHPRDATKFQALYRLEGRKINQQVFMADINSDEIRRFDTAEEAESSARFHLAKLEAAQVNIPCTPYDSVMSLVEAVIRKPARRGTMSTGENLVVALVLNRSDWLAEAQYTILEAVDRVGPEWTAAAHRVRREIPYRAISHRGWFKK